MHSKRLTLGPVMIGKVFVYILYAYVHWLSWALSDFDIFYGYSSSAAPANSHCSTQITLYAPQSHVQLS